MSCRTVVANERKKVMYIRKHGKKWQCLVRLQGISVSQSFVSKADAEKYAREKESEIDKGIMTTYDEAGRTTLRELLERYRLEITRTDFIPFLSNLKL